MDNWHRIAITFILLHVTRAFTFVDPYKKAEFPLGIVKLLITRPGEGEKVCSGSLIGNRTVITAAHCLTGMPAVNDKVEIESLIVMLNLGYGNKFWCTHGFWKGKGCVEREVNVNNPDNFRIPGTYIEANKNFFDSANIATKWTTADIAVITVDKGFFETKTDQASSIFKLPNNLVENGAHLLVDNIRGAIQFESAGYGHTIDFWAPQKRPHGGYLEMIDGKELIEHFRKELRYQTEIGKEPGVKLEGLIGYNTKDGSVSDSITSLPSDYIKLRGSWGKPWTLKVSRDERENKGYTDHELLPEVRPTMCFGDSGGPTFKRPIIDLKLPSLLNQDKILIGVNSLMDDLCQQYQISTSIEAHLDWIENSIVDDADRKLAFGK